MMEGIGLYRKVAVVSSQWLRKTTGMSSQVKEEY